MKPQPHSPRTYIVADHPSALVLVYRVEPDYSDEARKAGLQGTVALRLAVDTNGLPANIQIVRGVRLGLDGKAVEAVKQWKFRTAYRNGQSISVETAVEVEFRL
jgi:periplasmic protein TonB